MKSLMVWMMDRMIGKTMKRTVSILPFLLLFSTAFSQDVKFGENPFGDASDKSGAKTEWTPTHPDGETPQERMLSLAHTDALPRFNRAELFAVSLPDPKGNERPKKQPDDKTFPVRPYGVYARRSRARNVNRE